MCAFKTPPYVPGKRPHELNMRAFAGYTRRLPERTHGGVLNLHTEGFPPSLFFLLSPLLSFSSSLLFSLCVSLSIPLSLSPSLSLVHYLFLSSFFSLSSVVLFLRSLLFLSSLSLFSLLSETMTMITRPVGSLCVHTALSCSEGQSACALAHSLFGEQVHIICKKQLS